MPESKCTITGESVRTGWLYNLGIRVQFRASGLDVAARIERELEEAVRAVLGDRLEGIDHGPDRSGSVGSDPSNLGGERVKVG